eukprot:4000575-Alexandrium_andersonii.AAC.1
MASSELLLSSLSLPPSAPSPPAPEAMGRASPAELSRNCSSEREGGATSPASRVQTGLRSDSRSAGA